MGIISVTGYRPIGDGAVQLMELIEEGRALLQQKGLAAASMQHLAGSQPGSIAIIVNYSDTTEWAASVEQLQADEQWGEFYVRAMNTGCGEMIEQAIYSDLDPAFAPDQDRPLGAATVTQWQPRAGKGAAFVEHVMGAKGHLERLGGTVRVLQSIMNTVPLSFTVSVTFEDLAHLAEHNGKLAVDEQWAAYWADVMADPTAELVRTGTYKITV